MKRALQWLREYWPLLIVVWLASGAIKSEIDHPKARAGDECGPGHHWVQVGGPDPIGDISCEPDQRNR